MGPPVAVVVALPRPLYVAFISWGLLSCALSINLCTLRACVRACVRVCVCRVVWIFVLNLLALVVCFIYKVGRKPFSVM